MSDKEESDNKEQEDTKTINLRVVSQVFYLLFYLKGWFRSLFQN